MTVSDCAEEALEVRTPVTRRPVERIKQMIADGELRPGDRLPTERELCVAFGVSRSSLREAVRTLTTLGVLEARHGAGVYVTALRPADLLSAFSVLAEVSAGDTLLEILQVRRMLEPAATAMAAARATDEQLRQIGSLVGSGGAADGGGPDAGPGFHEAIVAAAGNATLSAVNAALSSQAFNARLWKGAADPATAARLREDHRRIHEALCAREPEAARAAATAHILEIERILRADLAAAPAVRSGPRW
ncbi:FadR/GntR family transcriptional regulator [Nocardiopsis coralliicola]